MAKQKTPYTPMMMHYLSVKEQNPDTLILYRLGDFYELFFEDAKTASRELQLVLTGRDAGAEERVPMCGMPFHAVNGYIEKLIKKGYKVGIVEQLEDASVAQGLVKRDIIQIITPGTLIDVGLDEKRNNYIASIEDFTTFFVIGFSDLSTGELGVLNCEHDEDSLANELETLEVKEVIVSPTFNKNYIKDVVARKNITVSTQNDSEVTLDYEKVLMEINDIRQMKALVRLIDYLTNTQRRSLDYLQTAKVIKTNKFLQMDSYTRFNLELTRTIRSDDRYGSLLWILDKTLTAMGGRLLKNYLVRPLQDYEEINKRQEIIACLLDNFLVRQDLSDKLKEIYDLARLVGRIGYGNTNGKDLIQLAKSLEVIPAIKELLISTNNPYLIELGKEMKDLAPVYNLIVSSIVDNPPLSIKEGGIIKEGYNSTLDELRSASKGGKEWISNLEISERERTGIKGLKVGFNKVFGFYIEVTKSYLPLVKEEFGYERKQTLAGAERFITPELKEKEQLVLGAEDKAIKLEYELFLAIKEEVKKFSEDLQTLGNQIAYLDVLYALSEVANNYNFTRPKFNNEGIFNVEECRHPVIEKVLGHQGYVPNDIKIDKEHKLLLITGPNMGGKSTYMRQVAILVILAQIGSYVPAKSANLSLIDKIFTRIGASDDLVSGQSTFMVEMSEANNALRHATNNSLIIFDEIGRGTSTYDGMALAQSIIEYIACKIQAFTLFSTHYHELTKLEGSLPGLKNISVGIHEENDRVTFLYKIIDEPANKSYGINVARLAHLPDELLNRAQSILNELERNKVSASQIEYKVEEKKVEDELLVKLKEIDPLSLSPMEALNILYELNKEAKKKK